LNVHFFMWLITHCRSFEYHLHGILSDFS
jgi:hypothetical protein